MKVKVEHGALQGIGSADPYVKGGYCQDTTRTYYGEALAVVRADGTGPLIVKVSDEKEEKTVRIPCRTDK